MSKILLTNKNSAWGIKVRQQSSNVYENVLSFGSTVLKDEFINSFLMNYKNGENYKEEIKKQPSLKFVLKTATMSSFSVSPYDYSSETSLSLLNKDYAIVMADESRPEELSFYALISKRKGNSANIEYSGELDIFFTYDIKSIFSDQDIPVQRGMLDRFYKNEKGIQPITTDLYDKLIALPEDLESGETYPLTVPEILNQKSNNNSFFAEKCFNLIKWKSLSNAGLHIKTEILNEKTGYSILIIPMVTELSKFVKMPVVVEWNSGIWDNKAKKALYNPKSNIKLTDTYINSLIINPNSMKNSYSILPISPTRGSVYITEHGYTEQEFYSGWDEYTKYDPNNDLDSLYVDFTIKKINGVDNFHIFIFQSHWKGDTLDTSTWIPIKIENTNITIDYHGDGGNLIMNGKIQENTEFKSPKITLLPKLFYNQKNYDIDRKISDFDYETELKSYFFPYRYLQINSSTKNKYIIIPQMLNDLGGKIIGRMDNFYDTSRWGYYIWLKDYKTPYLKGYSNPNNDLFFADFSNYTLPTTTNAWEEFIIRNKSQQNSTFLNTGLQSIGGLAGVFSGSPNGLLAGGSIALKSAMNLNTQFSKRKDIQRTPDTINNGMGGLVADVTLKNISPVITDYTMLKNELVLVRQHFYKYGYNLSNNLININKIIDSRYYFNYIEATETFENIALSLSTDIKQLIDETMSNGLTIWHYRDGKTYKGVKNYNYENLEMSIYNKNNKGGNKNGIRSTKNSSNKINI